MNIVTFLLRLPSPLREKIRKIGEKKMRSINSLILEAIEIVYGAKK